MKKTQRTAKFITVSLLTLFFGVNLYSAASNGCIVFNDSFGTSGAVFSSDAVANGIVQDASGNLFAAGSSGTLPAMSISKYTSSGIVDGTFGTAGSAIYSDPYGGTSVGYAIALDGSGKILVAGAAKWANGYLNMAIWRYNSNGTLDTTFGTGGVFTNTGAAGGVGNDMAYAITIDANGKILAAGKSLNTNPTYEMAIWRLNTNGTLDTTFNSTGYNTYAGPAGADAGYGIAVDSSGKIIVAGSNYTSFAKSLDMAVWRYNSNGTLDTTFGTGGIFTHNGAAGGSDIDVANAITIDAAGNIITGGFSCDTSLNRYAVVWRLTSAGALDATFNATGYSFISNMDGATYSDSVTDILTTPSGKIMCTGFVYGTLANDYLVTVWQYNSNGTPDTAFNGCGYMMTKGVNWTAGSNAYGRGLLLSSNGEIIVAGSQHTSAAIYKLKDSCAVTSPVQNNNALEDRQNIKVFRNVINPLKGDEAKICFRTKAGEKVRVVIYNKTGTLVRRLFDEKAASDGEHCVIWNGRNQAGNISGSETYIVVVETKSYNENKMILVVK